ncbi:MAG: hypothetical protein JKY53_01645 [Flavobacteriales bacterium]|nr:hypothetical protein [Flavobacteriales bacterium]
MKKLLFVISILTSTSVWATSTSPGTRNVNINDGFVEAGFPAGGNGTQWETDEVFQGFSGIVNWYLTWDDTNLYIGRIGGNNIEGSLIYLRAEYTGANFIDSTDVDYDGFKPKFMEMSGINFAAYLKDSYNEFKTYDGANWNMTANTLNDNYTTQADGDHMEVVIPWNDITAGNGKPENLRAVMYQVVPQAGCEDNVFPYGESPWGDGQGFGGPTIGINDGTPISLNNPEVVI